MPCAPPMAVLNTNVIILIKEIVPPMIIMSERDGLFLINCRVIVPEVTLRSSTSDGALEASLPLSR